MAQMDINEAVLQVERMCEYSKDFAALEAIRAFVAEVQNSSHNSAMPKCSCEVYNVGDLMGDIAIDKDCPFHGSLLNTSA